jgi:hypothetical protein
MLGSLVAAQIFRRVQALQRQSRKRPESRLPFFHFDFYEITH